MEKMNTYKVKCRMDGKESTTTVKAHNTNDALMTYLKSVSRVDGKIPKDYKIDITLAQECLCNGGKFLYMLVLFGCVGNYQQFWWK